MKYRRGNQGALWDLTVVSAAFAEKGVICISNRDVSNYNMRPAFKVQYA
jgi:hypothetical protein